MRRVPRLPRRNLGLERRRPRRDPLLIDRRHGRPVVGLQRSELHAPNSTLRVVRVSRPTTDRFDEALALLQASDRDVYGGTDWTPSELRQQWDEADLGRDAWLVDVDERLAGVAQLVERIGPSFIGDGYVH